MGQVLRRENVAGFIDKLHKSGKTVVATNGCFDILHVGHVRYLQKTKSFADYSIVLLNSDKSVRAIKGPLRPINNENDRAEILCALSCVDYVVMFDDDSPRDLLDEIKPDVYTKDEITQIVGGMLTKTASPEITHIAPPLLSDENTLALALGEEEIANLAKSKAKAALVPLGVQIDGFTTIEVERPRLAMMKLLNLFYVPPVVNKDVHPSAVVAPSAQLGQNVCIGPNVVVSPNAVIGDNTKILANSYIGSDVKIGNNCFFHPGVNIGDRVQIGNNVILQHGVSLGADGFSFVTENPNNIENARKEGEIKEGDVEQVIFKIPSIGSVVIGNNVEIGANTVIGDNTKIDDLVMIGHNCRIGKGCLIVSQVGIAGSCVIGDRVVIAGQAGLADHIEIGSDTIITAKAGVTKSFPAKSIIVGIPAVPRKDFIKQLKTMKDAQEIFAKFRKFEPMLKSFEEAQQED